MAWRFERVADPFEGPAAGLAWDGAGMLFSILSQGPRAGEGRILRFDPNGNEVSVFRAFTNRTSGIAFGRDRALYGCQELSRRIVRFNPDGSASLLATLVDGRMHNLPTSLAIDSRDRIWFCDSRSPLRTSGPLIYPQGELESVLRLEKNIGRSREGGNPVAFEEETGSPPSRGRLRASSALPNAWRLRRLAAGLDAPRAIALSPDERTLYVADRQGLHAFAVRDDALDARRRLSESALSGLNVQQDGRIIACAGASLLMLEASGAICETWPFPGGESVNCAFGGQDLYVTTTTGELWRGRP
jgi:sugar lactone lactonase YvrE